jgi:hypothetical protein
MPNTAQDLVRQYQAVYERADREGRRLTRTETDEVAELIEAAQSEKALEERMKGLGGPASQGGAASSSRVRSPTTRGSRPIAWCRTRSDGIAGDRTETRPCKPF